jgi:hypothetical protein
MKIIIVLLLMVALVGCATAGYNPSYIISEAEEDAYVVED